MDYYQNKRLNGRPIIEGELVTPTPTNYTQQKALPNQSYIDGSVNKPTLSQAPTMSQSTKQPIQSSAQVKPTIEPTTTTNPVTATTKLAGVVNNIAKATPAIQAGINASQIMNQEADFANKIHAGSIADPNFGNEILGTTPQKTFSRTITPQKNTATTGVYGTGRGAIEPMPDKTINTRAGSMTNPDYTEYTKRHPSAIQSATTINQSAPTPANPAAIAPTTPVAPKLSDGQVAINDYKSGKSGTGWIKMGDREAYIQADNKGKVALYNQDGSLQKNIDGHGMNYQSATGRGSIQSNAVPTLAGVRGLEDARNDQISSANNKAFMDDLNAQVGRGEISSNQARQQFEARQISQMPMNERSDAISQAGLQSAAWRGDTKAAAELANANQQKRTLSNNERVTDHTLNNPVQKLAEQKAELERMVLSENPEVAQQGRQGLAKIVALTPVPLTAKKRIEKDAIGNSIESTELVNPYTGQAPDNRISGTQFKEGDSVTAPDGTQGKIVRGQFVPDTKKIS